MTENESTSVNRRSVLKGLAGGAAIGAGGVGAVTMMSSPVAASTLNIELGDAEMETILGEVAYLASGFQGYVAWENQPESIERFSLIAELNIEGVNAWNFEAFHVVSDDEIDGFGREWDTFETGQDGHFTFHIPNPDGSLQVYSDAEEGDFLEAGTEDNTWIIARDDDALNNLDEEELPFAVNPDYGLPDNPLDAGEIPIPDEGDTTTHTIEYRKTVRLRNDVSDLVEEVVEETSFNLKITHLEGQVNVVVEGETAADGA